MAEVPVQPTPVVEAPVAAPAPVAEAPAAAFVDPFAPAQPEPAAPKKKGKALAIAAIAVVAAAAVFVACIAGPLWFGWFPNTKLAKQVTKWFGSDEAYMSAVEAQTVNTLSDSISKGYGSAITNLKDVLSGDKYTDVTISLELGDTVKTLLESAIAEMGMNEPGVEEYIDLVDLLDGASISMAGGNTDDLYKIAFGIGIGGEDLLAYDMIYDLANLEAFMAIPTISDAYLDISQIFDELDMEDVAAVGQAMDLIDALPSEEVVNKLLKKYIQLALDQFTNVSKENDTLKVGGISEKVTVLTTKIGPKDVMKAAKAVLKELPKDSDVKAMIIDLGDAMGVISGQEGYGEELYDNLIDGLDDAAAMLESAGEYTEDGAYVILTDYVNGSHEIVGRKISAQEDGEKQEMFYYATATKGNDYAFEMEVQGMKVLTGKGTNQKGILNGTYSVDGAMILGGDEPMDLVTIKVVDYDSNAMKENHLKGTFIITPGEELMEMALGEAELPAWLTSSISLMDCNLKITADMSLTGGSYGIALCAGTEILLGFNVKSSITDTPVEVPAPDKVFDVEDIDRWLDTVDLSKLIASLEKLGLPKEITDALKSEEGKDAFGDAFADAFVGGIGGGSTVINPAPEISWGDDYYEDDWYEDDYYEDEWYEEDYDDNWDGDEWYEEDVEVEIVAPDSGEMLYWTDGNGNVYELADANGDGIYEGIDLDGDGLADVSLDSDMANSGFVTVYPVD